MKIAVIKQAFAENRLGFEVLAIFNVNQEVYSKLPLFVKAGVERMIEANEDAGEHDNVMRIVIEESEGSEVFVRLIVKPIATFSSVQFSL
ncbi:hypothetical protein EC973_009619 [Apophysomyces ossiformis]|uniref:Uncharacterized protein n=1 Tax=Apophysomyces ossiformis TaxID=679940 RepID=A0A8H7EPF8_9FUNG|nr:hypothetical protein EC973_009619 [Apophysomyces ossiformis]